MAVVAAHLDGAVTGRRMPDDVVHGFAADAESRFLDVRRQVAQVVAGEAQAGPVLAQAESGRRLTDRLVEGVPVEGSRSQRVQHASYLRDGRVRLLTGGSQDVANRVPVVEGALR